MASIEQDAPLAPEHVFRLEPSGRHPVAILSSEQRRAAIMMRRGFLLFTATSLCIPALALYDPKPLAELALLQGEWRGTLTYNDYSRPGRLVTLTTKLFAALTSPADLTLHYVYDDGPGKTIYSYERMTFQPDGMVVVLASVGSKPSENSYAVVSRKRSGDLWRITFEQVREQNRDRFTLESGTQTLLIMREEIEGASAPVLRNEYKFRRAGA